MEKDITNLFTPEKIEEFMSKGKGFPDFSEKNFEPDYESLNLLDKAINKVLNKPKKSIYNTHKEVALKTTLDTNFLLSEHYSPFSGEARYTIALPPGSTHKNIIKYLMEQSNWNVKMKSLMKRDDYQIFEVKATKNK